MDSPFIGLIPFIALVVLTVSTVVYLGQIASGVRQMARSLESIEKRIAAGETVISSKPPVE